MVSNQETERPDDGDDGRRVALPGLHNARDLGGLPTTDGGETAFGGYIRSADLRFVPMASLELLRDAGFRTVLDLRNDFETRRRPRDPGEAEANAHRIPPSPEAELPEGVFGVREPLDAARDVAFWARIRESGADGSPLFFRPVLDEQPERVGAVMRVLADAPGGVLFHCAVGRDRTGLVSLLLLALADVEPEAIADDYGRTAEELVEFTRLVGYAYRARAVEERMERMGTSIRAGVLDALDGLDVRRTLARAGVSEAQVARLRARLRPEGAADAR
ncbi:tyrosine-protein phosphatase [Pseudoclavibacter chungangensis]|uniref:Tyrosine-protein phosphatase n=1 Tax=Pseudoclavibacter chungangensis TaxID=587635 RepID=A0A7J5C1P3_9MICO|nr:tyrosine-protein phosphatase [Pseudoclavibacter chungangensis]KAB1662538.1 tyrosine-protein phosphatase [Pseudoclavibacter chungangensis]NYJ68578.1 protein tyrosine phosphatase (PTP) superfamily phosphohydrolase (DUF442 family) [Pseudoclavibacter chungangensis]